MGDIEKPEPADPFTEIIEPLVEGAPDPDEVEHELLATECTRQARLTAAYWLALQEKQLPDKVCTRLTSEWLWLGAD